MIRLILNWLFPARTLDSIPDVDQGGDRESRLVDLARLDDLFGPAR